MSGTAQSAQRVQAHPQRIQVTMLHAQTFLTGVTGAADVVGGAVDSHARDFREPLVAELGRQHKLFAHVAYRPAGLARSLPAVTGARRAAVLGKFFFPG